MLTSGSIWITFTNKQFAKKSGELGIEYTCRILIIWKGPQLTTIQVKRPPNMQTAHLIHQPKAAAVRFPP